jgi:hypothetical protein
MVQLNINNSKLKSEIFLDAIMKRNTIRFLYCLQETTIDPYFIARNKLGKKVIYGRDFGSSVVRKYEYDKIINIKILKNPRFSPIIPILCKN